MKSRPLTPEELERTEHLHRMAIIDAMLEGKCAMPSISCADVCLRQHGHTGQHESARWKWGLAAEWETE